MIKNKTGIILRDIRNVCVTQTFLANFRHFVYLHSFFPSNAGNFQRSDAFLWVKHVGTH